MRYEWTLLGGKYSQCHLFAPALLLQALPLRPPMNPGAIAPYRADPCCAGPPRQRSRLRRRNAAQALRAPMPGLLPRNLHVPTFGEVLPSPTHPRSTRSARWRPPLGRVLHRVRATSLPPMGGRPLCGPRCR